MISHSIQSVLNQMTVYEKQWRAKFAIDEKTGRVLHQFVHDHQPRMILELGTWRGASAIYLASALRELGRGKLISVDMNKKLQKQAMKNIRAAELSEFVQLKTGDIDEILKQDFTIYDVIFIDAAKKPTAKWLKKILKDHVHHQSIIIIDDIITMKFRFGGLFDYVASLKNYQAKIYPIDDGLMFLRHASK